MSAKGFEGERQALLFTLVFVSLSLSLKIPFSTLATFCALFIPLIPQNSSSEMRNNEGFKVLCEGVYGMISHLLKDYSSEICIKLRCLNSIITFFLSGN